MKNKKIYSGIGGQAVLDGIMMKNKTEYSLAVRMPDGSIKVEKNEYLSFSDKYKILGLPFIRGIFSLIDSMKIGMKTLSRSAELVSNDDEIYEQTKFEKWVSEKLGDKAEKVLMGIITVFSFAFALCLFMLVPAAIGSIFKKLVVGFPNQRFIISFIEGISRIVIFVLYIKLVSRMPEIRTTFEYHGSEHKCINCIESGLELTVDNVMKSSKEHKRCGTSFIVFVMIISIFFFMFIPTANIWQKFISRILLIPVVAGISYEVLRIMGCFDNKLVDILSRPGMWMQGLTTKEPNEKQVEVAIEAVSAVFDWKKFLKDNFGKEY